MAVRQQLDALAAVARAAGTAVRYVKPHGALYNRMARDAAVADAVLMTMKDLDPALSLLTLPDCVAMRRATLLGVTSVAEAFADRAYADDGNLIPRGQPGAVLGDAAEVSRRMLKYIQEGVLASISGKLLKFTARSVCVHGDTPDAVNMARQLRTVFAHAGIELRAFA
jgi:UPF0271 protein